MDKLINVEDVAEILGVSKATVNKMMKERGMPHLKVGKLVRFDRDDVLLWMKTFSRSLPAQK
jgi:excisionase family DNA binding protein